MTTAQYNETVDLLADNLYRFAVKSSRDADLAKDIVQEAFTRLWVNKANVDAQKVKSYLFLTVNRLVIDHWRKNHRITALDLSTDDKTIELPELSDISNILNQELDRLPQVQRMVIMLRDYEALSYQEIGQITGLTLAQVKIYIYRARKTLKTRLEKLNILA